MRAWLPDRPWKKYPVCKNNNFGQKFEFVLQFYERFWKRSSKSFLVHFCLAPSNAIFAVLSKNCYSSDYSNSNYSWNKRCVWNLWTFSLVLALAYLFYPCKTLIENQNLKKQRFLPWWICLHECYEVHFLLCKGFVRTQILKSWRWGLCLILIETGGFLQFKRQHGHILLPASSKKLRLESMKSENYKMNSACLFLSWTELF